MPYQFRNLYPQFTQSVNAWTKESEIYRNQIVYSRYNAWGNLYTPLLLEPGTYTFSVFVRTAVQRTVHIYAVPNDSSKDGISPVSSGNIVLSASADWQRLSFTFTLSIQRELWLRVSPISNSSTKLYVSAPQLETGSEMTLFEGYHSTWYIDEDGELKHTDFPEVPDKAFQAPLPKSVWRTDANYNNGYPYNELMPNVEYTPPTPPPEPEADEPIIMDYEVICDGKLMHSSVTPLKEYKLIDPVLTMQDSNAGTFEFKLPPFNTLYNECAMMSSTISVRLNGEEIWEGRPVKMKEDMWKNHSVTCEGELAYLNDIFQIPKLYEDVTVFQIVTDVIGHYNNKCTRADRRFVVGAMPTVDSSKYTVDFQKYTIQYATTLSVITDICNKYGFRMYVSKRVDPTDGITKRFIDFTDDSSLGENNTQKIIFGTNLVDYSKSYDFSKIVTALLPLGAKLTSDKKISAGDEIVPTYSWVADPTDPTATGMAILNNNGTISIESVADTNYRLYQYDLVGNNYQYIYISTRMLPGAGVYVIRTLEDGVYRYYSLKMAKGSDNQYVTLTNFKLDVTSSRYNENSAALFVGCYGDDQSFHVQRAVVRDDDAVEEFVTVSSVSGEWSTLDDIYVIQDANNPQAENRPIDVYGRIEKKVEWSEVTDPMSLYSNAVNYMTSGQFDGLNIELTALDMMMLGVKNTRRLKVGEYVQVVAPPYGLNKNMPIRELKIPLTKPEDMTYTVGDGRKSTLSNTSTASDEYLARLIAEKPEMSAVLNSAKQAAFNALMSQGNSYVTFDKNTDGSIRAIIVSDSQDYTQSTKGYWIFTNTGIGFVKRNGQGWDTVATAMTNDGAIVADMITTGLLAADRIRGGTLGLGHWAYEDPITHQVRYTSGVLEVRGAEYGESYGSTTWTAPLMQFGRPNSQSGAYKHGLEVFSSPNSDDNPFTYQNIGSWVCLTNGNICFGHHNEAGDIDDGLTWDERPRIYGGSSIAGSPMYGSISVQAPGSILWNIDNFQMYGAYPDGNGTMVTDWWAAPTNYMHIQVRNKEMRFLKGILMDITNVQDNTYTGSFTVDGKTITVTDGLITSVENAQNNNQGE